MVAPFASPDELREVMDRTLAMMSEDPVIGPRLRDADVPQRFEFPDAGLVLDVRGARDGEPGTLRWAWGAEADWEPRVRMTMSSEIANRYFQGKENIATGIARGRIRTDGDVRAALALVPITKPIFDRYARLVAAEYPHLTV